MADYSHTIAIARDLLASGRSGQAVELLGSISMPRDADDEDEAGLLRALAARAVLMEHDDANEALRWLAPYQDLRARTALSDRARSETSGWLAWAMSERPDAGSADLILCLFAEAVRYARPDQESDAYLWSALGRARLLRSLEQPRLSAYYRNLAQAYAAQNVDPQATRWLSELKLDSVDNGTAVASRLSPDRIWTGTKPLLDLLELFLDSGYPVVLAGETGCGRQYTARALHARKGGDVSRFLVLDAKDLLLNRGELLHPSVSRDRENGGPQSAGGTVILQNLHSAPASILRDIPGCIRDLVSRGYRMILATEPLHGSTWASNLPDELYTLVRAFAFEIPPLRDRRDELPSIVRSVAQSLTEDGGGLLAFTDAAVEVLATYDWPGNVDELVSVLDRLQWPAAVDPLHVVDAHDLDFLDVHHTNGHSGNPTNSLSASGEDLSDILERVERNIILQALGRAGGHVTTAAQALGLSRQGLYKKMKRLEIDPQRSARTHSSQG
jgi:transcriptional regulator of acetoin/glycerol metabolism